MTPQEKCEDDKGEWRNNSCVSKQDLKDEDKAKDAADKAAKNLKDCESADGKWENGKCTSKKELDKAACESPNTWQKNKCMTPQEKCEDDKGEWRNNSCVSKQDLKDEDKAKDAADKAAKNLKDCESADGKWENGKCTSKKELDKAACESPNTWQKNKCMTPQEKCEDDKDIWYNGECITKKEDCENKGGKWSLIKNECVDAYEYSQSDLESDAQASQKKVISRTPSRTTRTPVSNMDAKMDDLTEQRTGKVSSGNLTQGILGDPNARAKHEALHPQDPIDASIKNNYNPDEQEFIDAVLDTDPRNKLVIIDILDKGNLSDKRINEILGEIIPATTDYTLTHNGKVYSN